MKKLLKSLFLAALAWGALIDSSSAQSTTAPFTVVITLNSTCTLSAIPDVTFTYTSFGPAVNASNGAGFDVRCTNGLDYDIGLFSGTAGPFVAPGANSIGPITDAVVNLAYTLTLATTSATGDGNIQNYSIGGTMAANQGGNCTTAVCTNAGSGNRTHTLMVSW